MHRIVRVVSDLLLDAAIVAMTIVLIPVMLTIFPLLLLLFMIDGRE